MDQIENNDCIKCLWYTLSLFLAFFALIGNFIFFALFGMPYELIKCYRERPLLNEDQIKENQLKDPKVLEEEEKAMQEIYDENGIRRKSTQTTIIYCVIGFFGFLLQPLYILFYVTYGLLEFYRRVRWIFFCYMGEGGFSG